MRILITQPITLVLQAIKTNSEDIKPVTQYNKQNDLFLTSILTRVKNNLNQKFKNWGKVSLGIFFLFFIVVCLKPHCTVCRILVPWPGIEPKPSAGEAWSPNHWTITEFPKFLKDKMTVKIYETRKLVEDTKIICRNTIRF